MGKNKKKNNWVKKRHTLITRIAKAVLFPIVKIKYGAKIIKCKDKRQRIILANHQTGFDQFFVAYGYRAPIYYLASEDIFSNGFISKLLRFAVNPIPIKKQATDVRAVMNCIKVAKEGGSIAIFPEGNRTFSGTTEYISVAIVKLVKSIKLPISFFRIEGGYGVQPRWSDVVRKGQIRAYTAKTIEPEDYLKMTDEELYELIKRELYVDEREILETYKSKRQAEYLERTIYVCPYCGVSDFISNKNTIRCKKCNKQVQYLPDKHLKGVGYDFPFKSVKEWYDYQSDYVLKLPVQEYFDKPLFNDAVSLFEVELYKKKTLVNNGLKLISYGNRFEINDKILEFDKVSAVSVLGKNKLNIYYDNKVYQIKGDKRFNAIKYVNIFYCYKYYVKGDENGRFIGL